MESREWHLVLQAPWSPSILLLGLGLALAALGLQWWNTREMRRADRRLLLGLLRLGAISVVVVLFLQPALQVEDVVRAPNHVAILVDASESMALGEEPGKPSRAERAAACLRAASGTLASWRDAHHVDLYTFGDGLAPAAEHDLARQTPTSASATRLREALAGLRARYQGRDLGGVIVLSDGLDNGRFGPDGLDAEGKDMVRALGAPVHAVWAGRPGLRDLAVARVLADEFAFARNAVKVEAVLRVSGARQAGWHGRSVQVSLKRDGAVVRSVPVTLDERRPEIKVAFEFTPERVGKFLYEVSVPLLDGEAVAGNNARTFVLKVVRDKIRVLQVAGRPSWDERFLRGLLKRDPNVDLISFFILRTPTDVDSVPAEEMSLIPFPTEELFLDQLRSFDVVFLQDFNFGPYGMGAYLGEIKRYVEEGGGLVMIGGELSFTSGGYARTPVADVLPVELIDEGPPERLLSTDTFQLALTPEGRTHPIMALALGGDENQRRWNELPPLEGANQVARARPGATVLGVHPVLRGLVDNQPLPVVAVADFGRGRSLSLLTDSSWRWGFGAAARAGRGDDPRAVAYQRFWERAIRWLIRDPESRLLRVDADRPEYAGGEAALLRVLARDPDYRPAKAAQVAVALTRAGAPSPVLSKTLRTDEDGEAEVETGPLEPGGYRVTARRLSGGGAAMQAVNQDEQVFLVRGAGREHEEVEARDGLLRALAEASDGRFRTTDEGLAGLGFVEPRVVRVNRRQDRRLWSTGASLLLAVALLASEWALRRRWGLR